MRYFSYCSMLKIKLGIAFVSRRSLAYSEGGGESTDKHLLYICLSIDLYYYSIITEIMNIIKCECYCNESYYGSFVLTEAAVFTSSLFFFFFLSSAPSSPLWQENVQKIDRNEILGICFSSALIKTLKPRLQCIFSTSMLKPERYTQLYLCVRDERVALRRQMGAGQLDLERRHRKPSG